MTSGNDPSDDERVVFSVIGLMRFDAQAVAQALRSRPLNPREAHGLADLLEGKHPNGLRLEMQGQGKGWKPIYEKATAYDRLIAVGKFVEARQADNNTLEEAVIDAAEEFQISESTVYRDLQLYRLSDD